MRFVQLIEFSTTRIDEFDALVDEWLTKTEGRRSAEHATEGQDRDRPNTYVQIVEFPSFERAMANSADPDTSLLAERLAELCDGPMTFRNLDVRRDQTM
jgi:hypothetical protein